MKHDPSTRVDPDDWATTLATSATDDQRIVADGRRTADGRPAVDTDSGAGRRSRLIVLGVVGAAALLVGAGVAAIRQLSAPALDGDAIAAPGATPVTAPDGGASSAPANGAPSVPSGGDDAGIDDGLADVPQARPAEYVDLDYTWTAYAPDSPEALALRFDSNATYALGTADGPDGSPATALYSKTDDGWQAVQTFEGQNVAIVGDVAYTIKTEDVPADDVPADDEATDASPTETLRAYDIGSDSWSDVALPDGAANALPAGADSLTASTSMEISSAPGALLVKFNSYYEFDLEALNLADSSELTVNVGPDGERELVVTDFDCVDRISSETRDDTEPASGNEPDSETANMFAECDQQADPAELGLTDDEIALVNESRNTYWTLTGDTWRQLELPDDGSYEAMLHPGGIVETYAESGAEGEGAAPASRFYVLDANGTFRPLFDGRTFVLLSSELDNGSGLPTQRALLASDSYLLSQDITASDWSATDLNALGDGPGWGSYAIHPDQVVGTANGGVIALGTVNTNLPTEATELTSGDYTIRFAPGSVDPTVTNNATGERVDDSRISTESGQVDLVGWDDEGNEVNLASFDTDWTDVPELNVGTTTAVLASTDGVRFGVIDADALIEMTNAGTDTHLSLSGLHESDGKIVVSGAVVDRYGEYAGGDYVFVGTPN